MAAGRSTASSSGWSARSGTPPPFCVPGPGGSRGSLTIGADGPPTALDIVERFRRSEPAVRIDLVMGNAASTWADLIELRTDVAVLAGAPGNDRVYRRVASQWHFIRPP